MTTRRSRPLRPAKSIVTGGGDRGQTSLLYGGRVSKADARTEAYGCVDEAISALGLARASTDKRRTRALVLRVQRELFVVGAELATDRREYSKLRQHFSTVTPALTADLEEEIAGLEARVRLARGFVVPGGSLAAAALDLARSLVRTAERRIVGLQEAGQLENPEVLRYVNRLSDLLFMLARFEEGRRLEPLRQARPGSS